MSLTHLSIGSSSKANAAHLVQQLVSVFPAFEDQTECRGVMTYLYKRAQLVVFSLHRRFHVRVLLLCESSAIVQLNLIRCRSSFRNQTQT